MPIVQFMLEYQVATFSGKKSIPAIPVLADKLSRLPRCRKLNRITVCFVCHPRLVIPHTLTTRSKPSHEGLGEAVSVLTRVPG
jgi:hypothetical protein